MPTVRVLPIREIRGKPNSWQNQFAAKKFVQFVKFVAKSIRGETDSASSKSHPHCQPSMSPGPIHPRAVDPIKFVENVADASSEA
jgi:hypothetical protein